MPCRENTSKALRYGTHSQGISQFYLHTPRSSANGMNHTCLCLPNRSWYLFTNPGGTQGWVGLGKWNEGCIQHTQTQTVTFMPSVELTRSLMAVIWLLWKWIAINSSMPPKDARTPLILHIIRYYSWLKLGHNAVWHINHWPTYLTFLAYKLANGLMHFSIFTYCPA